LGSVSDRADGSTGCQADSKEASESVKAKHLEH
jgi:hypothetical protein